MRVTDVLALARRLGVERLDAQLLLAHHLRRPRSWLLAHDDETVTDAARQALHLDLQRRADGVPLAHLVGHKEFRGRRLEVTPAVLVPRPETELLVDWALQCLVGISSPRVLDLGTGSGAIAVTLALERPDARVDATDVDPSALAVAQGNAAACGARVDLHLGTWWQPLGHWQYEIVVSNPPYIAEGDPHLPALAHEPRQALVAGDDGLDALRVIAAGAVGHLVPGAWLLVEHGHDQGPWVRELFGRHGLAHARTRQDLAGLDRCTGARRPP